MPGPWDNDPVVEQQSNPSPQPTTIGGQRTIGGVPASERRAQEDQDMQRQQFDRQAAIEAENLRLRREADARATEQAQRQQQQFEGTGGQGTEAQNKAAVLLGRITGGAADIDDILSSFPEAERPGISETIFYGALGPESIIARNTTDWQRRAINDVQRDIVDALLTMGTGAAYNQEQLEAMRVSYFPQYGDSEQEIDYKRRRLQRMIETARLQAGPNAARLDEALAPLLGSLFGGGTESDAAEQDNPDAPLTNRVAAAEQQGYGDDGGGNPLVLPDGQALLGYTEGGAAQYGSPEENEGRIDPRAQRMLDAMGQARQGGLGSGHRGLANQGAMLGLGDELYGGVNAAIGLASGDGDVVSNYQMHRDARRAAMNEAREQTGVTGLAAEMFGGTASVVGRAGSLMRAGRQAATSGNLTQQGVRQALTRQATREGALVGGIGGFGYGEGFEGSTSNALVGAIGGGLAGNLMQRTGNTLASRAQARAAQPALRSSRARELTDAAERVGMEGSINRAMVDPASNNAVTRADASLMGGPTVQREMNRVAGDFEQAVGENLGAGGRVLDDVARGDTAKAAAERWIKETGKIAKRRYDRAEQMAGDATIEAETAISEAQTILRRLQETPETNAAEIKAVQSIVRDLDGPDGVGLSVGGLRRMRTALRKRISKGELVFGEDEANVLAIMDAASNDIANGLTAQGRAEAAEAFRTADASYRARSNFIKNTVQKLIGPRNSNLSAGQIARKINSLETTDYRELNRVYSMLDPEERLNMAATMAQRLGRKSNESVENAPFSLETFLTNTKKMNASAMRAVFGEDGARAMSDLRLIGNEIQRVRSSMNSRTSKSGVAGGWREFLYTGIAGGGFGFLTGNAGSAAAVGTVAVAANAVRQGVNARLLMSPRFTRWLRQAPRTTDGKAIDRHFALLGEIARAEPALAQDIEAFRSGLLSAANDNVGRVAAEEQQPAGEPSQP